MVFDKHGITSIIKDLAPKHSGYANPFGSLGGGGGGDGDGDGEDQFGCAGCNPIDFQGCLAKLMGCGPLGCAAVVVLGGGLFFLIFHGAQSSGINLNLPGRASTVHSTTVQPLDNRGRHPDDEF